MSTAGLTPLRSTGDAPVVDTTGVTAMAAAVRPATGGSAVSAVNTGNRYNAVSHFTIPKLQISLCSVNMPRYRDARGRFRRRRPYDRIAPYVAAAGGAAGALYNYTPEWVAREARRQTRRVTSKVVDYVYSNYMVKPRGQSNAKSQQEIADRLKNARANAKFGGIRETDFYHPVTGQQAGSWQKPRRKRR